MGVAASPTPVNIIVTRAPLSLTAATQRLLLGGAAEGLRYAIGSPVRPG